MTRRRCESGDERWSEIDRRKGLLLVREVPTETKSRQVSLESKELVEKKRTSKESYVVVIITV